MRTSLLVIALALALGAVSWADESLPSGSSDRAAPLIPGIVRPSHDVMLAAPRDGVLAGVYVREGDVVVAGQRIAQLDDRAAKASVEAARAISERVGGVAYAQADLELARSLLERLEKARKAGAAGPTELHEARSRVALAQASVDIAVEDRVQAQMHLELERARLAEHSILAPFDGVVVETPGEPGGALTLGSPIARVVALDMLRGEIYLPGELFGRVAVGDGCVLDARLPEHRDLEATVIAVDPRIHAASATFRCWVELENPGGRLPAGFTVLPRLTADGLARPTENTTTPARRLVSEADGGRDVSR